MQFLKTIDFLKKIPNFSQENQERILSQLEMIAETFQTKIKDEIEPDKYTKKIISLYETKDLGIKIAYQYEIEGKNSKMRYTKANLRLSGDKLIAEKTIENIMHFTKTGFPLYLSN